MANPPLRCRRAQDLGEMWRRYDGDDDGQIMDGDLGVMIEDPWEGATEGPT